MKGILLGSLVLLMACQSKLQVTVDVNKEPFDRLSDYRFFAQPMADLSPNEGVLPFAPITPLFSDYAEKARFVWMPAGEGAKFNPRDVFDFPMGAVLIKNFFYYTDPQRSEKKIVETRLLVHREEGWDALTYIWNDEQSEAFLEIIGDEKEITFIDHHGQERYVHYLIPNKNQCKSCHERAKRLEPIGPRAPYLNHSLSYEDGQANQLDKWSAIGYLDGYTVRSEIDNLANWSDPSSSLDDRALAYLEVNCGTCHQAGGNAYVSGLHLTADTQSPSQLGICKSPVSAGKGSGGHQYDILPGQPDSSILVYRMETLDPGAMMPELGRKLIHEEGVALIREWIANMTGSCP